MKNTLKFTQKDMADFAHSIQNQPKATAEFITPEIKIEKSNRNGRPLIK